ncbi:MAG: ABC transporter permease [Clostridiales Family XIII bacterium]|nr:ABC transporter permease [Clostridiales Family XIII bacterium]
MRIKEYLTGIWHDRHVLLALVNSDLSQKYRGSVLGVAWMILTPLGLALILGTVFTVLFAADPKVFIPRLFIALNTWIFLSGTADGGTSSLIGAEGYLKQTTVNAQIFPLRMCMVNFTTLFFSILAFFAGYAFLQPGMFGPMMLLVIPGLVLNVVFAASWAMLAAVLHLYFRDFQPFQNLVIQGLFYATPIIYDASMLAERGFGLLYQLNPFYYMLDIVVKPLMGIIAPSGRVWVMAFCMTAVLFLASIKVFMRVKRGIALRF